MAALSDFSLFKKYMNYSEYSINWQYLLRSKEASLTDFACARCAAARADGWHAAACGCSGGHDDKLMDQTRATVAA